MRRSEREVKDISEVLEFIAEEDVIRLALTDADGTYIVPVNYGSETDGNVISFYFHGSGEGRKASALVAAAEAGSLIPFEIDGRHDAEVADGCDASYYYMSVMGNATVEILGADEKVHGLETIMNGIMPAPEYYFIDAVVEKTMVCRLNVKNWSCKKHQ